MKKILTSSAVLIGATLAALVALAPGTTYTPVIIEGAQTIAGTKTFSGGVGTPIRAGTDYTMAATAAPTYSGTDTSGGFCTNAAAHSYTFKISQVNPSGESSLSTISTIYVPTGTSKKMRITRPSLAATATGWDVYWARDDAPTTYKLCASGSVASLAVAAATTTYDCACFSGSVFQGSNTTGFRRTMGMDVTAGVIDTSTFAGGVQNLITEGAHQLTFGSGLTYDGTAFNFLTRVVNVCSTCTYTTITAACAANTSTAALPVKIEVGPMVMSDNPTCGGQDHLVIKGAGRGASIINGTGQSGGVGVFRMLTSTNWTIDGFTVNGQRGVSVCGSGTCDSGVGVGGGAMILRNFEYVSTTNQALEDCIRLDHWADGASLLFENNDCTMAADGLTLADAEVGKRIAIVSRNNRMPSTSDRFSGGAFTFVTYPQSFYSINDITDLTATNSSAGLDLNAYRFLGQTTGGCTTGCYAYIVNPIVRINNLKVGAAGAAEAVLVDSTVGTPLDLHIINPDFTVTSADPAFNGTYGVVATSTAGSNVTISWMGGRSRTSGGNQGNNDASITGGSTATITMTGVNYGTIGAGVNGRREFGLLAHRPTTCAIGDHYSDTSGADCVAVTSCTWEKTNATGACNV